MKASVFDTKKLLLVKRLCISLQPKKPDYTDYLTSFELLYRSIRNLNVFSNSNLDFVKSEIKDVALRSFRFFNVNFTQHLSNEELEILEKYSKNNNLVVQKADKDNSVVLLDRDGCVNHMESIP